MRNLYNTRYGCAFGITLEALGVFFKMQECEVKHVAWDPDRELLKVFVQVTGPRPRIKDRPLEFYSIAEGHHYPYIDIEKFFMET